jgi:hypothetical protein
MILFKTISCFEIYILAFEVPQRDCKKITPCFLALETPSDPTYTHPLPQKKPDLEPIISDRSVRKS